MALKPGRPTLIVNIVCVLTTVGLHCQLMLNTCEVEDETAHRMLAAELVPFQSPMAKR